MESTANHPGDWQSSKTLAETNLHMLDSQLFCDITFDVGSEECHTQMQAHKYMLISRSCVFESMFLGPMAEKGSVRVTDIDPETFKQMLRYIYSEHVDIQTESVLALLYAAKKYCLTSLVQECVKCLSVNMKPDTACNLLEQAHRFDEPDLAAKALKQIFDEGDLALQSDYFPELCTECMQRIIKADDLTVANEEVVFEAMKVWATQRCSEYEGLTLREAFGELLYLVRFPLLSSTYFKENVRGTDLLSSDEENEILMQYLFPAEQTNRFNRHFRKVKNAVLEVWRLPSTSRTIVKSSRRVSDFKCYDGNRVDAIAFTPSRNILLHGFRIWGRNDGSYTYKISFSLHCVIDKNDSLLSEGKREMATNSSDLTYAVLLDEVVRLSGSMKYTLEVKFEAGPSTYYSKRDMSGSTCAECQELDASFIFMSTERDTNGTSPAMGQIPALLFSFP